MIECPAGSYCVKGSSWYTECPSGTTSTKGQFSCVTLPASEYAVFGSASATGKCKPGYYCEDGSWNEHAVACPLGTYYSEYGATKRNDCKECPAGFYCREGAAVPTRCPHGYYCVAGTFNPAKCPIGTYGSRYELTKKDECTKCPAGTYCSQPGLPAPEGLCDAGFYCVLGAESSTPRDGASGDICPAGGFCEAGSRKSKNCPPGRYNPNTGGRDLEACILCPPGKFCSTGTNDEPDGSCTAGYYCPSGSYMGDMNPAPPGYYTEAEASTITPCEETTYNPYYAQSKCLKCPPGFLCIGTANTGNFIDCPEGKYCPEGSNIATSCPAGTYNPNKNGKSEADCLPCPAGKFCSNEGLTAPGDGVGFDDECSAGYFCRTKSTAKAPEDRTDNYGPCKEGHYCPKGSSGELPCPPGTYSGNTLRTRVEDCRQCTAGQYCMNSGLTAPEGDCDAGYFCEAGSILPRSDAQLCPKGYYCPKGSSTPTGCGAGTYQDEVGQAQCKDCLEGFFCDSEQETLDGQECLAGYYCPAKTPSKKAFPCKIGQYNPFTHAYKAEQCIYCDPGQACEGTGNTGTTGPCNAGYYCTLGSPTKTPPSGENGAYSNHGSYCTKGHYCPEGSSHPIKCPGGWYCSKDRLAKKEGMCSAGYYCRLGATDKAPVGLDTQGGDICPIGHYCTKGSDSPTPCPPGTYNPNTGATSDADCKICDDGNFCQDAGAHKVTGLCHEGYYCKVTSSMTVGYTVPNPASQLCPEGHYCPAGTEDKIPCVDEYQDLKGQGTCKPCPAGYYCNAVSKTLCQPRLGSLSFYCPDNVMERLKCGAGTYNVKDKSDSSDDCVPCPPGNYCPNDETLDKIIPCAAGYYCETAGSIDERGNGKCPPGTYCPAGSQKPIPCPAGKYCEKEGLTPADLLGTVRDCDAGFICRSGATLRRPTDGNCPEGHYCTAGTKAPVACPIGYFRTAVGGTSINSCSKCTEGRICPSRGLTTTKQECTAGYYCPVGSSSSSGNKPMIPCPIGAYCSAGSSSPEICPDKTYQNAPMKTECIDCPAGYFCNTGGGTDIAKAAKPEVCIAGHYCPERTSVPIPCPSSTFSARTGLKSDAECESCTPGHYCDGTGRQTVSGECDEGYYCMGGSKKPKPKDSTGNVCSKGHYCPKGSVAPVPCPPGTYSDKLGLVKADDCTKCNPGYFCPLRGATSMDLKFGTNEFKCLPGYVCLEKATIPNPTSVTGYICPVGHYCPMGSSVEMKCEKGKYNPDPGQASCLECPEGRVCPDEAMTAPKECSAGHYCPAGSNRERECPIGTYSPFTNLKSKDECIDCEPGWYCSELGKTGPTGKCKPGFVCPKKAVTPTPASIYSFALNYPGQCPQGYICPEESAAPTPCLIGTYNDNSGQTACKACPKGKYCDELAMTTNGKPCAAGHLCTGGATHARPLNEVAEGGRLCTKGHYCPEGTQEERPCPAGSYEPREGSAQCQTCPAGYTCEEGCHTPKACEVTYYCPKGSVEGIRCPAGTFGRAGHDKLEREDQCTPCPSGRYCKDGIDAGACDAGYYCDIGAIRPNDGSKLCPSGHYCLQGAKLPTRCNSGKFNIDVGATDADWCKDCTDGYYCISGLPIPIECPVGHYCIPPADKPTLCPAGTYQDRTTQVGTPHDPVTNPGNPTENPIVDVGGVDIVTPCKYCPEGAYCYEDGIYDPSMYPCPVGKYCRKTDAANFATYQPEDCPEGTYRNTTGGKGPEDCLDCPGGYYCAQGNAVHPQPCRGGYYCPPKSKEEFPCKVRKYCPPMTEVPLPCPEAYYCDEGSEIYKKCDNGFYCPAETDLPEACPECTTDLNTDTPCPDVILPIPCPAGYIGSNNPHNINIPKACSRCTPGYYSLAVGGQTDCMVCTQGYVCLGGTNTDRPTDVDRDGGHECPEGYYCPAGTYVPIPCPKGTYSQGVRKVSVKDCLACPEGTFNPSLAASSCLKCGGSSVSSQDRTTCVCKGKNRAYQVEDATCLCRPQYEPVDGTQRGDSTMDCQPLIYERCKNDEVRDSRGKCREKNQCPECPNGDGSISSGIGVCECRKVSVLDSICNENCRDNSLKLSVNYDGDIRITDPSNPTVDRVIKVSDIPNLFGSISYSDVQSKIVSIQLDSIRGFAANYQPAKVLTDLYNSAASSGGRRLESGRRLDTTEDEAVTSPAICINSGDTLYFAIASADDYPVYDKDNLLNSNPDFDYSLFTALAEELRRGTAISSFAYTFNQPGRYVLYNNNNRDQITIIGVMGDNLKCSDEHRYIQPITTSSLLKLGLSQTEDIILTPDWPLIFGLIAAIIVILPLLVWFMRYFTNSSWLKKKPDEIEYRELNKTASYDDFVAKGKVWKRDMLRAEEDGPGKDLLIEADDERIGDPNQKENEVIEMRKKENEVGVHEISPDIFRDLYKELQYHAKFVKDEFAKKAGMDSENIKKVFDEVDRLRKLMQEKLQNIAKSYGKGIRLLFDEDLDNDELIIDEGGLDREKSAEKAAESEDERTSKEVEFNHDVFNDLDDRDQENAEEVAEVIRQAHIAIQNDLSQEEKDRRKALERELQDNKKLSNEEKKLILEDYDKANAKLRKLLMVEEQTSEDKLQQVLEQRRRRRRKMQEEVAELEKQKQQIQDAANDKLDQIAQQKQAAGAEVDEAIEREREEEMRKMEERKQQVLKRMKDKFQKKLNDNLSENERAEIFDSFNKKMQVLENELAEEQREDLEKLGIMLDMKRQKKKAEREAGLNAQEKEIKEEKQRDLKACEDRIRALNENLENEQIDEAVKSVQEDEQPRSKEREKLAKANRKKEEQAARQAEEEAKKQREALLAEEEKEIQQIQKLNEEAEAKINEEIIRVKDRKAELNERLAKTSSASEKKALLEEFKQYQDAVAGEVRRELAKQNGLLADKVAERRRLREAKEAEVRLRGQRELDALREQNRRDEEDLKRSIDEQKLRRQIEIMQEKLMPDELPFAVERLVDEKHFEELSELLKRQFSDKARVLKESMQALVKEKADAMQKVNEEHELQTRNVKKFADKGLLSKEDYEGKLKELEERRRNQTKEVEYNYAQKQSELEEQKLMQMERANSEEMMRLVQDQAARKLRCMDEFVGDLFVKKLLAGDERELDREMELYKQQIDSAFEQRRFEIDEKRKKIEEMLLNDDNKIKELEMQAKKMLQEQEMKEKKHEEKKKKIMQEKMASKEEELKQKGITDEEKKRILEEHQKELDRLQSAMDKERARQRENQSSKIQDKLKHKEVLQRQRQEQLALLRKEDDKLLDEKIKEIQKERGIETEEQKDKLTQLSKKYDPVKEVFDKMKPLSGVDLGEVKEEENVLRGIIDIKKQNDKDYSKIDLSFELLFDRVKRLLGSVNTFTGLQFEQIFAGFLDLNSKFEAIASGNIPKPKPGELEAS